MVPRRPVDADPFRSLASQGLSADCRKGEPMATSFFRRRLDSLVRALREAPSEEIVRGFLALVLVGVLLALVFNTPSNRDSLVSSAETLAIAVIAFYFGLHKGTPHRTAGQRQTKKAEEA